MDNSLKGYNHLDNSSISINNQDFTTADQDDNELVYTIPVKKVGKDKSLSFSQKL